MTIRKIPLRYELNADQNPELLKREGQLQAAERLLTDLQDRTEPLPKEVCVSITVPEEHWLERVETGIAKINRVVEPAGFMDRVKGMAIRKTVGLQGDLHLVRYERDQDKPAQTMHVFLNLSGVAPGDLENVSKFLKHNARRGKIGT